MTFLYPFLLAIVIVIAIVIRFLLSSVRGKG